MTRNLLSIYSVLVVAIMLLAVFVPSCTTPTTGTIEVDATLDGSPWIGPVSYTLTGAGAASPISGTSVEDSFNVDAGNWTCAYVSGGPGTFVNITPSENQTVSAGGTITFTLNFVTPPVQQCTIEVKATLDGSPWTGAVNYTLTGPGISPTNTTSVPKSFSVDAGNWTCAYVSGGPGTFVNITPSATQTVSGGGTITFTLNFVTPVTSLDASVKFISWSINGARVPPGTYTVKYGLNTTIDAEYEVYIAGNPNEKVTVKETDWLQYHYKGPNMSKHLHAVNSWAAVFTTPPSTKKSQMTTVEGNPAPACTMITAYYCEPVKLDVETTWEQNKGTNYTKTINWLGIPSPTDILFDDVDPFPSIVGNFTLQTWACVEVEGDVDPTNDCSGNSTILFIEITP